MNYPTGMGVGTGNHYHNVAAQMQAYLNHPAQSSPYGFQGRFAGQYLPSQVLQYGAHRMGINPMVVNEVGGFARNLIHNILS